LSRPRRVREQFSEHRSFFAASAFRISSASAPKAQCLRGASLPTTARPRVQASLCALERVTAPNAAGPNSTRSASTVLRGTARNVERRGRVHSENQPAFSSQNCAQRPQRNIAVKLTDLQIRRQFNLAPSALWTVLAGRFMPSTVCLRTHVTAACILSRPRLHVVSAADRLTVTSDQELRAEAFAPYRAERR